MSAKKWIAIVSGLAVIATIAAAAPLAADVFKYLTRDPPPVHVRVRMDSSGFKLRQDFRVTEYCSYDFDLRLIHTQRQMGEFDSLMVNESLPISVTVDVYRLDGQRTHHIAQLSGPPKGTGGSPDLTVFSMGFVRLDEGHYRAEISSTGDAPQLAGIEADFVVQVPPKTNCPKKGRT